MSLLRPTAIIASLRNYLPKNADAYDRLYKLLNEDPIQAFFALFA